MKASELMTGDFLRYNQDYPDTHLQGKIVKVCGIRGRVDVITIDDGNYHESVHPDWLEPIPLTPKILKKNGFEKKGEIYDLATFCLRDEQEFGFSVGALYRDSEEGLMFVGFATIHGIHQLQNAIRLCGIKKEIVL